MRKRFLLFCMLLCLLALPGCGGKDKEDSSEPPVYSPLQVLEPTAPGTKTEQAGPVHLDFSNESQGYFTVSDDSNEKLVNLQLTAPDGVVYKYFIRPGESAVVPFSGGSGDYILICYQQVEETRYAAVYTNTLQITLDNEFLPFLYPNQYVNFNKETKACQLALSIMPDDTEDTKALEEIYNYVTENITYDMEKAATVEAGYLPDIDETLETGTGICFDYAALITAMLRSRDIPCKLEIGYAGDIKHAWVDVYIRSRGWVNHAIEFDGESWTRLDPTFESSLEDKEVARDFIGDGTNYALQFSR